MKNWFIGTGLVIGGAIGTIVVRQLGVNGAWMALPISVVLIAAVIKVRYLFQCKRELDAAAERHGRLFG